MSNKRVQNQARQTQIAIAAIGAIAVIVAAAIGIIPVLKSKPEKITTPNPVATVEAEKVYLIRSVLSGKVITVGGNSNNDEAPIVQDEWVSGENQKWIFEPLNGVDSGFYMIRSASSGKCLDVIGSTLKDGIQLIQYTCEGTDNQKWQLISYDSGVIIFKAKHSGKVLDVSGSSKENGAPVLQYSYGGTKNQQWIMTETDP